MVWSVVKKMAYGVMARQKDIHLFETDSELYCKGLGNTCFAEDPLASLRKKISIHVDAPNTI